MPYPGCPLIWLFCSVQHSQSDKKNQISRLLTFTDMLRHMVDLRKPHYGSHASDPMYHPMKLAIARL